MEGWGRWRGNGGRREGGIGTKASFSLLKGEMRTLQIPDRPSLYLKKKKNFFKRYCSLTSPFIEAVAQGDEGFIQSHTTADLSSAEARCSDSQSGALLLCVTDTRREGKERSSGAEASSGPQGHAAACCDSEAVLSHRTSRSDGNVLYLCRPS